MWRIYIKVYLCYFFIVLNDPHLASTHVDNMMRNLENTPVSNFFLVNQIYFSIKFPLSPDSYLNLTPLTRKTSQSTRAETEFRKSLKQELGFNTNR